MTDSDTSCLFFLNTSCIVSVRRSIVPSSRQSFHTSAEHSENIKFWPERDKQWYIVAHLSECICLFMEMY